MSTVYSKDGSTYTTGGITYDTSTGRPVTTDGGFLLEGRFSFKTLTSPYQAEEMAEVILRRSREAITLGLNVSFDAYDLAIGDIVNITHSSLGFSAKAFRVLALSLIHI